MPFRVEGVHHGYPPLYNAESMVNAQDLGLELRRRGESVAIFSREADPSRGDYEKLCHPER